MVKLSQRKEIAKHAIKSRSISVRHACRLFMVSESCYRHQSKFTDENAVIADWLLRLSYANKTWGFGLCFLFLRNIKGFSWNRKRVYRIYRLLELNLWIRPKRRLSREVPGALTVPLYQNEVWSMDFMHEHCKVEEATGFST